MPQITTTVDEALQYGITCHQAGNLGEAESVYRQILIGHPDHADALHLLGVLAHQQGHHDAAIELIDRAIRQNDSAVAYHYNLALALRALGREDEAATALRRAVACDQGHADAHAVLGAILQQQGNLVEAAASYRAALAANPQQASTHNNLASALLLSGDPEQALAAVEQALALDPKLADAHNTHGNVLRDLRSFEDARASYERALALAPDYADVHFNLGLLLQDQAKLGEAADRFERALTLAPRHAAACFALAHVLAELGRLDGAMAQYERGLALRPRDAAALVGLGTVLLELGEKEQASAKAFEALRHADRPSVAIGTLLLRCGHAEAAREQLEACLGQDEGDAASVILASMGLRDAPDRPLDAEVRKFYSGLAAGWDEKMRLGERYFGPAIAAAAVDRLFGEQGDLDILDAGCGTGLAAELLRRRARRLDGVDLSPEMLAVARAKGGYDLLAEGDLVDFLRAHPASYDLVFSVAALIMSRDLRPAFAATSATLRANGLFVMTLFPHAPEREGEEGRLQINGTYTHGRAYVARLAGECGFLVELMDEHVHELSWATPVKGLLIALRKGA